VGELHARAAAGAFGGVKRAVSRGEQEEEEEDQDEEKLAGVESEE
jgi:Sec-independent protein translocase protein TatA